MYSHGDLAGVRVCGGWPGPGTFEDLTETHSELQKRKESGP